MSKQVSLWDEFIINALVLFGVGFGIGFIFFLMYAYIKLMQATTSLCWIMTKSGLLSWSESGFLTLFQYFLVLWLSLKLIQISLPFLGNIVKFVNDDWKKTVKARQDKK